MKSNHSFFLKPSCLLAVLMCVVTVTEAAKLNDTGITTWSNNTSNGLTAPQGNFPKQDADVGRDKTVNNNNDGRAGFSFSKISGQCVKDNVTGLIWELKTNDNGLHDKDSTYSWYEPDKKKNGGNAGTQNGGQCNGSQCNTDAYVKAVNTAGWCGAKNWRLPTVDELFGLVALNAPSTLTAPLIDKVFGNTPALYFWSSQSATYGTNYAWGVSFRRGQPLWVSDKVTNNHVRLVRGPQ